MRTIRDEDASDDAGVALTNVSVAVVKPKAMLVCIDGDEDAKHWIPLSCIHDNSEIYVDEQGKVQGAPGTLTLKTWFAEKENLG